jgi:hypothetical protein
MNAALTIQRQEQPQVQICNDKSMPNSQSQTCGKPLADKPAHIKNNAAGGENSPGANLPVQLGSNTQTPNIQLPMCDKPLADRAVDALNSPEVIVALFKAIGASNEGLASVIQTFKDNPAAAWGNLFHAVGDKPEAKAALFKAIGAEGGIGWGGVVQTIKYCPVALVYLFRAVKDSPEAITALIKAVGKDGGKWESVFQAIKNPATWVYLFHAVKDSFEAIIAMFKVLGKDGGKWESAFQAIRNNPYVGKIFGRILSDVMNIAQDPAAWEILAAAVKDSPEVVTALVNAINKKDKWESVFQVLGEDPTALQNFNAAVKKQTDPESTDLVNEGLAKANQQAQNSN